MATTLAKPRKPRETYASRIGAALTESMGTRGFQVTQTRTIDHTFDLTYVVFPEEGCQGPAFRLQGFHSCLSTRGLQTGEVLLLEAHPAPDQKAVIGLWVGTKKVLIHVGLF
jgi:hypothetical protein